MRPLFEIVRESKRVTRGSAAVTAEQLREQRSLFWEGGSGPYPGFPPLGRSFAPRVHVYVPRKRDRVIVEGGTIYDPRVFESLRELVAAMPEIRSAALSVDNTPPGLLVGDVLDQGWRPPTRPPGRLYHGTSSVLWDSIQHLGLWPRQQSGMAPVHAGGLQDKPSRSDRVYLTSYDAMGPARFASADAVKKHGGERVILEIDTSRLRPSLFEPDEDAQVEAFRRAALYDDWPEWALSLARMGTVAYRGRIPPEAIRLWATL